MNIQISYARLYARTQMNIGAQGYELVRHVSLALFNILELSDSRGKQGREVFRICWRLIVIGFSSVYYYTYLLEYSLSLTKTMYKVQTKILNNQIIN